MNIKKPRSVWVVSLALVFGASAFAPSIAFAGKFRKKHPRRAEVNGRQRNQQGRIANGLKNGSMSAGEAQKVEAQEAAIKQQERADVKTNGGYLTKGQQKQINHELNQTSKEVYQDKHN